jgi:D-tyrosyl-tRNA(Tyr) deacylase
LITVVQRVSRASVTTPLGRDEIGKGLLVLLGVRLEDCEQDADELAAKIVHLRIFEDEQGKMNRSLLDERGSILVISQFTLLANTGRGRRPSFEQAAPPAQAVPLYDRFVEKIRSFGIVARTGVFGAHMDVELINEGPVTLILRSKQDAPGGDSLFGRKGTGT